MRFALLLSLVFLLATGSIGIADESTSTPLNVLLITADDLGLQLGCYGDQHVQTPRLDEFATRSVLFTRAWVTQASCSPSRSSLFTGRYPHSNGQYGLSNARTDFELLPEVRNEVLPKLLQQAGYRTGLIGKLHVAPEDSFPWSFRRHFDTRDVRAVAREASGFMEAGKPPFFLMVNYLDPHVKREEGHDFAPQWKGLPEHPLRAGEVPPLPFQKIDTPRQLQRVTDYYNAVMRLDAGVGLLLDALEAAGHGDDTLVVFLSDHGPPCDRGKTTCYDAGLHVPLLVAWPGVSRPLRSNALVSSVDLYPTILDAAGVAVPEGVQGRSLRPLLSDPGATLHAVIGGEFHFHGPQPFFPRRTIRDERFHLIHNLLAGKGQPILHVDGDQGYNGSREARFEGTTTRDVFDRFASPPEFELYDLVSDPDEFHNLAEDPKSASELLRMKTLLIEWRTATADPLLTEEGMREMAAHAGRAR